MTFPAPYVEPVPDPHAAAAFIAALTGGDGWSTPVSFQCFDDPEAPPDVPGGPKKHRGDQSLARTLHGTLAGCVESLVALNAAGAGVFITVNQTDLRGRSASNVINLRALFVDSDTGTLPPELALPPNIRVRTVQGEHCYWLLRPEEPRDDFGPSQKSLIAFYGTDKSIHDLPRVMRLPGFIHRKGVPSPIQAWYGHVPPLEQRLTIRDIIQAHPKLKLVTPQSPFAAVTGNAMARLKPQNSRRDKFENACAELAVARKDRNVTLFRAARLGRDLLQVGAGNELEIRTKLIDASTANGTMAEEHEKTLKTIERALAEDSTWQSRIECDGQGNPKPVLGNVIPMLLNDEEWSQTLALNSRAQDVVWVAEPPLPAKERDTPLPRRVQEVEFGAIATWFTGFRKMTIHDRIVAVAVATAASYRMFDPVVDYLNAAAERWDGVPRLETVMQRYCGACPPATPEAYLKFVFKRWAIGAVARAMTPGCQMDTTLILEGDQGTGKTSFFRILGSVVPDVFGEKPPRDISGQKMQEFIRGQWIVEFGELSTFKKSEIEDVKSFLTSLSDRYRPAYGRLVQQFPRGCAFGGSTNGSIYFRDTENRRFLPVACGEIDRDALMRDRDQIWGEAVQLYDDGEQWDLTREEKEIARAEQDKRYDVDALEPAIRAAVRDGVRADTFALTSVAAAGSWAIAPNAASISVREILEHVCKDRGERSQALQNRITTILGGRMRWTSGFGPTGERRYFRPVGQ